MHQQNISFDDEKQLNSQKNNIIPSTKVIFAIESNDTLKQYFEDKSSEEYYEMLSEMRLA